MILGGTTIAANLIADLKPKIAALKERRFFGAALVGEDPASVNFLRQKQKTAALLGIDFRLYKLPADITTDELRAEIGRLAAPKTCGGFIVQLPLPEGINRHYALNAIPKAKDVDMLSEPALGAFYTGRHPIVPPAVAVVEEVFSAGGGSASGVKTKHYDLRAATVAMIGAGFLIGRPVGFWLQNRVAELMVFDISVKNLHEKLAEADIVISGTGHPKLFSAKHLKSGALVLDFGYGHGENGKISGDFDPEGAEEKNIAYTPTPGGTGPILVAELFENFWKLNAQTPA